MPKINEMSFKFQGFQYSMSLDLNMVYYHIRISKGASSLCTIILPWGNIVTNVYRWELPTHQKFSNIK